jgi:hypothetical protein
MDICATLWAPGPGIGDRDALQIKAAGLAEDAPLDEAPAPADRDQQSGNDNNENRDHKHRLMISDFQSYIDVERSKEY